MKMNMVVSMIKWASLEVSQVLPKDKNITLLKRRKRRRRKRRRSHKNTKILVLESTSWLEPMEVSLRQNLRDKVSNTQLI